jgi:dTDP-6-deoxy-L-talose 4-dehydrogenase (NAD+)
MKILLTGPTGFIGAAFTRAALTRGHSVAGLIIPSEQIPGHLPAHANLQWFRGTLDTAPWEDIQKFGPDVCVHTAWVTAPGVYLESPDNLAFRDSSIQFLRKAVQLATKHVVGLGTCIEYQITNEKLSEEKTSIAPTTTYARCKDDLRQTMEAEAVTGGFGFCWARVFYPYGPREHPSRLCSAIIQKLSRGEKIVLKTPDSTKDYIFIEDLAAALLTVVEKQFRGAINLGTGEGRSVRQIAQTIGDLMGKRELIGEANPPEKDPVPYVVSDNSRLRNLGWQGKYGIDEGIGTLLKFYQAQ